MRSHVVGPSTRVRTIWTLAERCCRRHRITAVFLVPENTFVSWEWFQAISAIVGICKEKPYFSDISICSLFLLCVLAANQINREHANKHFYVINFPTFFLLNFKCKYFAQILRLSADADYFSWMNRLSWECEYLMVAHHVRSHVVGPSTKMRTERTLE